MSDDRSEQQIQDYLAELRGAASLSRDDLDEVEDHLRTLTADLRDGGVPAARAVTEAAKRLGEPRTLAREHARVRNAFGAPLPRSRAWSAAALLTLILCVDVHWMLVAGMSLTKGLYIAADAMLIVGLLARCGWARAINLGGAAYMLITSSLWLAQGGGDPMMTAIGAAAALGLLALVAPWRRREMNRAGVALALVVPVYAATATAYFTNFWIELDQPICNAIAAAGLACALVTVFGALLRARWATFAATLTAALLATSIWQFWHMNISLDGAASWTLIVAQQAIGIACAFVLPAMLWRTSQSRFGSLRLLAH